MDNTPLPPRVPLWAMTLITIGAIGLIYLIGLVLMKVGP